MGFGLVVCVCCIWWLVCVCVFVCLTWLFGLIAGYCYLVLDLIVCCCVGGCGSVVLFCWLDFGGCLFGL